MYIKYVTDKREKKYVNVIYCEEFNTVLVTHFSVEIVIVYQCVISIQFLVSVWVGKGSLNLIFMYYVDFICKYVNIVS